jgi:phosphate uptake regulator
MEVRRVQMTGGSSYIITLPKEWVKKSNIEKNDPIGLLTQSDGTLLITSNMNRKNKQRNKEFLITEKTNETFLFRKLIGAYISGYDSITIKSKARMPPKIRTIIRKFIQTTIGQEVVEEIDNKIILKDLLNPAEMPFSKSIKRMHIMIKGMYDDVITSIKTKDEKLAEDIILRDNEVDRLHWLIARQHNILNRNVNLAEKMGITIEDATTSYLISKRLERIADHIIKIAENNINLIDKKLDEKLIKKIITAGNYSLETLNRSISSYYKKDIHEANENIDSVEKVNKLCEEVKAQALKQEPLVALSAGYILESIGRIGEYAEDISETVINHLVGK